MLSVLPSWGTMQINPALIKRTPIRVAIKQALRKARYAKDTYNRELYVEIREWLKVNIRKRNKELFVFSQ